MGKQKTHLSDLLINGLSICRGGQARTDDPLVPNQIRYQLRHTPNIEAQKYY